MIGYGLGAAFAMPEAPAPAVQDRPSVPEPWMGSFASVPLVPRHGLEWERAQRMQAAHTAPVHKVSRQQATITSMFKPMTVEPMDF